MTNSKKFFIASVTLFLATLLFWGIYLVAFKKTSDSVTENSQKSNASQKTATEKSKLAAISTKTIVSPVLGKDGVSLLYYSKNDGSLNQIDLAGNNNKVLSQINFPQIARAIWSPDKNKTLIDNASYFSFFDYSTGTTGGLNQNILNAAWQNEEKIIYIFKDPASNKGSINIANWDGTNWKKLIDLNFFNQKLSSVPRSGLISFWNNPSASFETSFNTVTLLGGDAKQLLGGFFGADYLWSPSGNKILISHSNRKDGDRIVLGVADAQGQNYTDLGTPTFVSKCVWGNDSKTIYCALPGSLPEDSLLPDDYQAEKFYTSDTFWKINTESGEKERLVELNELESALDAQDLFLNQDESMLFFLNRKDKNIYRLKL